MYAPKTPCSALIPTEYKERTKDAPAPQEGTTPLDTLKSWIGFGVAQTANIDTADDKRIAALGIIERCEERDAEAIRKVDEGKWNLSGLRG